MKKTIKIMSAIMCVAIIAGACFALVACNNDKTGLEDGTLNVATNCEFDPFEYMENGNPTGIDMEIMAAIANELGVKLDIKDMLFDSVVAAVGSGSSDIAAAGLTITPSRLQSVDFTKTYFSASQVVIAKAGDPILSLTTVADIEAALSGKTIGVQNGTTGYAYASGDSDDFDGVTDASKVKGFTSGALAVQAMTNGQVDYVIIDKVPADKLVAANQGTVVSNVILTQEQYAFAVKKGNKELLDKVNAALDKLIENGTIKQIFDKYGVDNDIVA